MKEQCVYCGAPGGELIRILNKIENHFKKGQRPHTPENLYGLTLI